MEAYIAEWANLLIRWLHFVAGIAWIGSSFYFIWLDNHMLPLAKPSAAAGGVGGEVWSVHGGGFYRAEKFTLAPAELPEPLHWFKWEAYTTWLSGMFLLLLVYWYGAEVYLIDAAVMPMSASVAVAIAAAFIVGGWIVYDLLCRSPLGRNEVGLSAVLFVLVSLLAWGLCQLFGGRGAYIHFGAVLGTIMVANVFFVIIPGQKRMVAAAASGQAPDPGDAVRAKQRSVHNTYFTLPVLFSMTSNHFSISYAHEYNWVILIAVALAGALLRVYFVARHTGGASVLPVAVAALLIVAVAALAAPRSFVASSADGVAFSDVRAVIGERCTNCHSATPVHPAFPAAPAGIMFDSDAQIRAEAERIHQQTVITRAMPIGNLTQITEQERALIDRWYRARPAGGAP